ncbi:MAG: alpha/beta fold hydrolase [Roseobacter sp.]
MTPIVFVHGFMGGSSQWHLQYADIGQNHKLICVDLPGFGKRNKEAAATSIKGFADSVIAELDGKGIDQFHLMGHSMGGMIAQQIVHQTPQRVKRLVLYGTGPVGVLPGRFETIAQSKARGRQDGIKQTARRIAATWFLQGQAAEHYEACASLAELTTQKAFESGLDAMEAWSGEAFLNAVQSKTLIVWGDKDRTYQWPQVEKLWRSIPDAELAVVPGCAHAVHMEKPDLLNRILLDFLRC